MRNDDFAKRLYSSRAWKRCRASYIQSVGGLCERCQRVGLITPGVEVHHKIKLTPENVDDASVSLNWDNLELLCIECHHREHSTFAQRRWSVDEFGNVIM